jgi:hypothetical protein
MLLSTKGLLTLFFLLLFSSVSLGLLLLLLDTSGADEGV